MALSRRLLGFAMLAVWAWLLCQPAGAQTTERVSVGPGGVEANNGASELPSISADGRYVAFRSNAANLVSGDSNGQEDVFVHDRQTGTTTRVSIATGGGQANFESFESSISGDGRYVAFRSEATNLVAGDTNSHYDIFVHDRQTVTTTRVSVATGGAQATGAANFGSLYPAISADGRFVAFGSDTTNLVNGDSNGQADVFVHDRQTSATTRVSLAAGGAQATGGYSESSSISGDGRYVAFVSAASNLVDGDTNGASDVFVHDRQTGTTTRVSVATDGVQANSENFDSSISSDGRFVAFWSMATNLVAGDTNGEWDAFVHDRQTAATVRVSVATGGAQANNFGRDPSISSDGRYVAFYSQATNLVAGDTNSVSDVFVRDILATVSASASPAEGGGAGGGGDYLVGTSRAVTATQSTGYEFVNWTEGGNPVSTNASYTFTLGADRTLVANFELSDTDSDGVPDVNDNCPSAANPFQADLDGDGLGNACDSDADGDGYTSPQDCDDFQALANPGTLEISDGIDNDCDGTADEGFLDGDSDGVLDQNDNCPAIANAGQADEDDDGLGDACDVDADGDGLSSPQDCDDSDPLIPGVEVADGKDNDCDGSTDEGFSDSDSDGVYDQNDNCPAIANADQINTDGDAFGDACDDRWTIALSVAPASSGTVTGAGSDLVDGTSRTVTATPNAGYRFVNWTEGGVQKATTASYTFLVTANRTLVANFLRTFKITVVASPAAGGTVTGGGTFDQGSSRTVRATRKPGYEFARWTQGGILVSNSASYTFSLSANRTLVAQFRDPRRRNDLLVDFGSRGLYRFLNNTAWQQLHTASPIAIAAGDLDGRLKDEAIASFTGLGLRARFNNSATWTPLHASTPKYLAVGDFDGNGKDDLAIDLGASGIWVLRNNALPFAKVRNGASQGLAAADLDGDGRDELLADLSTGVWALYNNNPGNTWTQLFATSPVRIATGNLDGNLQAEVIIDRGASGIFVRFNNAGLFKQVYNAASQGLVTADLDGNGKQELIVDRGATGIWARYNNGSAWTLLKDTNPVSIFAADLDKTGKAEVLADYGPTGIFARYNNAGGWRNLRTWAGQGMAVGGFD